MIVVGLDGLEMPTTNSDFESEGLVRLARGGAHIGAVPTTTVYGEETSSIRPLRDR